jgi:dipeptidase E
MRLLLLSNSTNAGEEFLDYPKENIRNFLGTKSRKALFIPYAAITLSYDDYEKKVRERFNQIGHDIVSIHHFKDTSGAVNDAQAIVVGGGNTFQLISLLWKHGLIGVIRNSVTSGVPYIGWSAGANIACPSICTTNDMPVVQPESFSALDLVKFQINPHYLDANPEGHAGETRETRITEFTLMKKDVYVAGLREGSMLQIENGSIKLQGSKTMRIFKYGTVPVEVGQDDYIGFLM